MRWEPWRAVSREMCPELGTHRHYVAATEKTDWVEKERPVGIEKVFGTCMVAGEWMRRGQILKAEPTLCLDELGVQENERH